MATNNKFNLDALKEVAAERALKSDFAGPVSDRNIYKDLRIIERNRHFHRGGLQPKATGTGTSSIERIRNKSRSTVLASWFAVFKNTVSVSSINRADMYYRRTPSGLLLLDYLRDLSDIRKVDNLLALNGRFNFAYNTRRDSSEYVGNAFEIYLDIRKELWVRVAKTSGFGNLIQQQERLLRRITNTLKLALSDTTSASMQMPGALHPVVALHNSHLATLAQTPVPEIESYSYFLEVMMKYVSPATEFRMDVPFANALIEAIRGLNPTGDLAEAMRWNHTTSSAINPDD